MKWLNIQQNTTEWKTIRLGKITASQFKDVMSNTDETQAYALQLALERLNRCESVNQISTYHMRRGHEQEPVAIPLYEAHNFTAVKSGGFFDCGYYGSSPDGLVDVDGLIEIKSVISKVHLATARRKDYDPDYHWQIIGHLDCTNRNWCDFVSYCADFPKNSQILIYRVYRQDVEKDIQLLREVREMFNEKVEKLKQEIMMI